MDYAQRERLENGCNYFMYLVFTLRMSVADAHDTIKKDKGAVFDIDYACNKFSLLLSGLEKERRRCLKTQS